MKFDIVYISISFSVLIFVFLVLNCYKYNIGLVIIHRINVDHPDNNSNEFTISINSDIEENLDIEEIKEQT